MAYSKSCRTYLSCVIPTQLVISRVSRSGIRSSRIMVMSSRTARSTRSPSIALYALRTLRSSRTSSTSSTRSTCSPSRSLNTLDTLRTLDTLGTLLSTCEIHASINRVGYDYLYSERARDNYGYDHYFTISGVTSTCPRASVSTFPVEV